jgi:hypothetical protein
MYAIEQSKHGCTITFFASHMRHALNATETNLANGSIQPVIMKIFRQKKKRDKHHASKEQSRRGKDLQPERCPRTSCSARGFVFNFKQSYNSPHLLVQLSRIPS